MKLSITGKRGVLWQCRIVSVSFTVAIYEGNGRSVVIVDTRTCNTYLFPWLVCRLCVGTERGCPYALAWELGRGRGRRQCPLPSGGSRARGQGQVCKTGGQLSSHDYSHLALHRQRHCSDSTGLRGRVPTPPLFLGAKRLFCFFFTLCLAHGDE